MQCPKCAAPDYHPTKPCSSCNFSGPPEVVETLAHLRWLLLEINSWAAFEINRDDQQRIEQHYLERQHELEIELGLRVRPFTADEAKAAWPELIQREALLQEMTAWQQAGYLRPNSTQTMLERTRQQIAELAEKLAGHERPVAQRDNDRLAQIKFLLEAVDYLSRRNCFVSSPAEKQVRSRLLADLETLEIKLGIRPAPEAISPAADQQIETAPEPAAPPQPTETVAPPASPKPPAIPFRERLWRTLLSERTLQALLFLGIFLLLTAALSFVIWGWQSFSAALRVAIPCGFTGLFFGLGWYVRTKTPLYRSGIALSAIAALLIPIDFYTVYANFNIPPDVWPSFWLSASLFCLIAYIVATLMTRSRFFGYLVAVAAGSAVLALIEIGHQLFGLAHDWQTAGLSLLALSLIVLSTNLDRHPQAKRAIFAEPFRYMALLAVGVLMPLTFGWRYLGRAGFDTLHTALTINWWIGGFIFGWGAVYHRSRSLGVLAAISLPGATYLTQTAIFQQMEITSAWHAVGFALLVPVYFVSGYRFQRYRDDPIVMGHGRTAARWGVVLLIFATLWPLTEVGAGAAIATSHLVLAGAVVLATLLWRNPTWLYGASLLSLSATTFTTAELFSTLGSLSLISAELTLPRLSVTWISLAIGHIIIAVNLGTRFPIPLPNYGRPLLIAGYVIAAAATGLTLFPYDGNLLAYSLGNWLGLAIWGGRLVHLNHPSFSGSAPWRKSIFHWFTALPLPIWLWVLFSNQGPLDWRLPLALAALAYGMLALSWRLNRLSGLYRWPWYSQGILVSLAAPMAAFWLAPDGLTPAVVLLLIGLLYFADALSCRQAIELIPAGLVTAWGLTLGLNRLDASLAVVSFGLTGLILLYFLAGFWAQRRRIVTVHFLAPLYLTNHILTLIALGLIYLLPFEALVSGTVWTDAMRGWGAASQLLLAVAYGLYVWHTQRERWAHLTVWLGTAAGGFIAISLSTGSGSSATFAALIAIGAVLIERGLCRLQLPSELQYRYLTFFRLTWQLYKRPLLIAGWTVSAITIGMALVRNLLWLGGARSHQIWAAVALLLIVGLYALSARLFRQARFVWLATFLLFIPWTILTNLGWFTGYRPTWPDFALSWMVLAWGQFLSGLSLRRWVQAAYRLPLEVSAHLLVPFALLWGLVDVETSCLTFALAIGFYSLAAFLDYRRAKPSVEWSRLLAQTKFLYPAVGLIPIWSLYLLAWLLPEAEQMHYGLLLVIFGPLGLTAGKWFEQVSSEPKVKLVYALPSYLTGYWAMFVGTVLVAYVSPLLALVLLFDAIVMVISAYLFKSPLWLYPAAIFTPVSLLLALNEAGMPSSRYGWWLIGLASIYLTLTWVLRRSRLAIYGRPPLIVAFVLVAVSLPYSSQDQTGTLWGYSGAVLLYGLIAFWFRQPLILTPTTALVIVPYAIVLQRLEINPDYYGLALFPGAILALVGGWWLDDRFGEWRDFPWSAPKDWPTAVGDRWLNWWGLPLYALGFGFILASPFLAGSQPGMIALNYGLMIPIFGWAIYRFRLRIWLFAAAVAGHLALFYLLAANGWWRYPDWAWLRFLPATLLTALVALVIEKYRQEGDPLKIERMFAGWSRPLYIILLFDIIIGQYLGFEGNWAGTMVTLTHASIIAVFVSIWLAKRLAYLSLGLGIISLMQWLLTINKPIEQWPVALSILILGYGIVGYGLTIFRRSLFQDRNLSPELTVWELPLQRSSLLFSLGTLVLTAWFGIDIVGWTLRAILGLPFRLVVQLETVQMTIGVFGLLGLLYLAAAVVQRWLRLGYVATGMLLVSWSLQAFYIQQWENLQFYAIPTGIYLLAIAFLEWQRGNKEFGRWLDYLGLIVLIGSLFWQTLLFGWGYALLLGVEGLTILWWGSARRLRRFLYAGMSAIILATLGQLFNSLWSINQWMVFGIIGALLVILAIIIERKLDDIKLWQESFETWE